MGAGLALFYTGGSPALMQLSLGTLLAAAALGLGVSGPSFRLPAGMDVRFLGLFWLWCAVTAALSATPYGATAGLAAFSALPASMLAVYLAPRPGTVWAVARVALAVAIPFLLVWQLMDLAAGIRPTGPFLNPNLPAAFVNLALPLVAAPMLLVRSGSRTAMTALGVVIAVLGGLVVGLPGSRGALLAALAGLALLVVVCRDTTDRRRLAIYVTAVVVGIAAANLYQHGLLAERAASLGDPGSAGASRFRIWAATWAMIRDHWLTGTGLGTFWLRYPPYRLPADASGGFYAHNDYLQVAAETGVVGVVLFLGFVGFVLYRGVGVSRARTLDPGRRAEAGCILSGLTTVGVHSLFTYNFYVLPTLVVAGGALGYLHELNRGTGRLGHRVSLGRWLRPPAFRFIVAAAVAVPLVMLGTGVAAQWHVSKARDAAQRGDVAAARDSLDAAARLSPDNPVIVYLRGDMTRQLLARGDYPPKARQALFDAARSDLRRAAAMSPYRPEPYVAEGDLLARARRPDGEVESRYRWALRVDPLHVQARLALGLYLVSGGQEGRALEVLEAGYAYRYPVRQSTVAYYDLYAELLSRHGRDSLAASVKSQADDYRQRLKAQAERPPEPSPLGAFGQ